VRASRAHRTRQQWRENGSTTRARRSPTSGSPAVKTFCCCRSHSSLSPNQHSPQSPALGQPHSPYPQRPLLCQRWSIENLGTWSSQPSTTHGRPQPSPLPCVPERERNRKFKHKRPDVTSPSSRHRVPHLDPTVNSVRACTVHRLARGLRGWSPHTSVRSLRGPTQSRTADVTCVLPVLGRPMRMAHAAGVNRFAVCSVQSATSLAHASDPNSRGRWWPVHPPRRLASLPRVTHQLQPVSTCVSQVSVQLTFSSSPLIISSSSTQQLTQRQVCPFAARPCYCQLICGSAAKPGPVPAVGTARFSSPWQPSQVHPFQFHPQLMMRRS
jgi:hypothetical protein